MRKSGIVFALLVLTAVACEDSTGPRLGYVQLSVQTVGGDTDDLFEITSDTVKVSITPNAIVKLQLPAGPRSFEIKGVADNCTVEGGNLVSVDVAKNDTVRVQFKVGCAETGIRIEARTTGQGIPNGFEVSLPSGLPQSIAVNGSRSFTRLAAGRYQVKLRTGVPNCSVAGDSVVAADVVNRQVTAVTFNIQCTLPSLSGTIAFTDYSRLAIFVMNADGSGQGELNRGWQPSWSRDGTKIVYSLTECDYYSYVCSGSLAVVDPTTRQITMLSQAQIGMQPDWSPTDDVIAYVNTSTLKLHIYNLATSTSVPVALPGPVLVYHPSWSPDGTQLVASCFEPAMTRTQLCTFNRDGTGFKYITTDQNYSNFDPTWSPDGNQIVFGRYTNGPGSITVINPDGSGVRTVTDGNNPSWSADSRKIVFVGDHPSGIFTINADGSALARLTTGNHYSPAWR